MPHVHESVTEQKAFGKTMKVLLYPFQPLHIFIHVSRSRVATYQSELMHAFFIAEHLTDFDTF